MSDRTAIVGIDLGTTFSLVATLRDGAPSVIGNALGEGLTPSAVSLDGPTVLVGAPARARATTHPRETALAFKRDMGTDKRFSLGSRTFLPQELSALVLAALKADAEAALGRPVEEAVITVPAYFGDAQRQATRDAGRIAGLVVERIINEPTAAALAYGLHERHREMRAVVLDVGGGTCDVTILEIMEGVIEIQASSGDARLGGEDFVDALAARLATEIRDQHGVDPREVPLAWARIREAAEVAKKKLSAAAEAKIAIYQLPLRPQSAVDFQTSLSRLDAESLWAPLLDRIRAPIQRAFGDASLPFSSIDEVLLVGGATRMPCIGQLVAQMFGRLPLRTLPPDEAVALGAAIQAGLKSGDAAVEDMVATDVAPFTIGIATSVETGAHRMTGVFAPIIDRGTVIPASRVRRFSTVSDLQKQVQIEVYQGEHAMCRDNQKLGQYTVGGLRAKPAGEEWFDVRFTYDLNGILEVETTVGSNGKVSALVIEETPGRLSSKQIEESRRAMARLKLHPRDALPNTTAVTRAEALYIELNGPRREMLGEVIAQFKLALEAQNEEPIRLMREHLNQLISQLKATV
jgi:molecular chaperone HscC